MSEPSVAYHMEHKVNHCGNYEHGNYLCTVIYHKWIADAEHCHGKDNVVEYSENNGLSRILSPAPAVDKICACAEKHGYQQEQSAPLGIGIICCKNTVVILIIDIVQWKHQPCHAAEWSAEWNRLVGISVNAYAVSICHYRIYYHVCHKGNENVKQNVVAYALKNISAQRSHKHGHGVEHYHKQYAAYYPSPEIGRCCAEQVAGPWRCYLNGVIAGMDVKGLSVKAEVSYEHKYPCDNLGCCKGDYVYEQSREKIGHKALWGAHGQPHSHINVRLFVKVAENAEGADKPRSRSHSRGENCYNSIYVQIKRFAVFEHLYHCRYDQHGHCHYVKNEYYHHQLEIRDDVLPAVVKHCLAEKLLFCIVHINWAVLRHNPSPPFRK